MAQSKKGFNKLEKGDLLSILIYCLVKANIPDLRSQMTLITEFTSGFIQDGHSRISATFSDLENSIEFIESLDSVLLQLQGRSYLKNFKMTRPSQNLLLTTIEQL